MGYRKEIINAVFGGNKNIWTNIVVSGSNAPPVSTTAGVGTFALCGTGAASSRVVWVKVCTSATGITASATGIALAGFGTWVRLNYGTLQA
jgi:hypothetical protein